MAVGLIKRKQERVGVPTLLLMDIGIVTRVINVQVDSISLMISFQVGTFLKKKSFLYQKLFSRKG